MAWHASVPGHASTNLGSVTSGKPDLLLKAGFCGGVCMVRDRATGQVPQCRTQEVESKQGGKAMHWMASGALQGYRLEYRVAQEHSRLTVSLSGGCSGCSCPVCRSCTLARGLLLQSCLVQASWQAGGTCVSMPRVRCYQGPAEHVWPCSSSAVCLLHGMAGLGCTSWPATALLHLWPAADGLSQPHETQYRGAALPILDPGLSSRRKQPFQENAAADACC